MSSVKRIAGVDEAGRGPLAGPVFAAAVILDVRRPIRGLRDSKQLDPEEREALAPRICERALAWSVAWADCEEIDALNILGATHLAMRRALLRLPIAPTRVRIDGDRPPLTGSLGFECPVETVIGGDATVPAISAASILAKVWRDAAMCRLDACYPGFELAAHKGYATPEHLLALRRRVPSPIHRRSFAPVRDAVERWLRAEARRLRSHARRLRVAGR